MIPGSYTEAESLRDEAIEVIEDALLAFAQRYDDTAKVERIYCFTSNDFEITLTFKDGSYLSLTTPTAVDA